jgi:hypothetical protein
MAKATGYFCRRRTGHQSPDGAAPIHKELVDLPLPPDSFLERRQGLAQLAFIFQ